jgi:glycosyltransferase involved in cell wall biosynthesis
MASVDVVVPCYQYGRYLRDCVTSILRQDVRDLRVLVIDNASTDNSLDVARELAAEDRRVQVVAHRANLGHHASFNEGIEWASSDYFMILGADDLLAPGCLSRAVSFMEKHPHVHLTHARALFISINDPVPHIEPYAEEPKWYISSGRELLEWLCRDGAHHYIDSCTVVVRTSVQKQVGFYHRELSHTDDLEMWMRFACVGAVARTNAVQGIGRLLPDSRSASLPSRLPFFEAAFESFFENEGASLPGMMRLRRTALRTFAQHAYWAALSKLLRGDVHTSRELWRFARTRCPTTIVVPPVGYLLRTDDVFRRMTRVVSEAARHAYQVSRRRQVSQVSERT